MTNYSQNDEQEVILRFFAGRVGRFLDIGAYDGVLFSNTRALLEQAWTGVMVEPNPHNLIKLMESVRPYAHQVEVLAAACAPEQGVMGLTMDEIEGRGWASTIAGTNGVLKPSPIRLLVPTITPAALLSAGPFNFISIDAEWMDFEILKAMPPGWVEHCELLCIEPSGLEQRKDMIIILTMIGFEIHHSTPENIIARRKKP